MAGRIARQAESYGLEIPEPVKEAALDQEFLADLLGGPRITAGLLRSDDDA